MFVQIFPPEKGLPLGNGLYFSTERFVVLSERLGEIKEGDQIVMRIKGRGRTSSPAEVTRIVNDNLYFQFISS